MTRSLPALFLSLAFTVSLACAQQPRGVEQAIGDLANQPATRVTFTYDRSQLQSAQRDYLYDEDPHHAAVLNSITVQTFHFPEPAFYTPETMAYIVNMYHTAGWQHLVEANTSPARNASPINPITDLWLHFNGAEIDDVTVLVRGQREMNLIQISCMLRPLDLFHLSGHFGIPRVDPNAVMVPAPNGR